MISLHPKLTLHHGLPGEILDNLLDNEENQGEERLPELWVIPLFFHYFAGNQRYPIRAEYVARV